MKVLRKLRETFVGNRGEYNLLVTRPHERVQQASCSSEPDLSESYVDRESWTRSEYIVCEQSMHKLWNRIRPQPCSFDHEQV